MKKALALLLVALMALGVVGSALADPTEISLFMYATAPFPPDAENPIGLMIQDATNTVLKIETPPASSYAERLQITLASGDLPDVMMFANHTDRAFIDAIADGAILPITEYVKNTKNLWPKIRDISWNAMMVDGEIYGIPQATVMRADGYFLRKDWIDALGIQLPEDGYLTLDEMTEILRAFTEDDPDKNGKNDTFGLVGTAKASGAIDPVFLSAFDLLSWQKYENEEYPYMDLKYSRTNPAYKNALAYTAMLWSKGYIDPNWPTVRGDEPSKERFNQGIGGARNAFAGQYRTYLDIMEQNVPTADLTYIAGIESATGNRKESVLGTGYWYLSALTSAAKGKEQAIIDMFDFRLSDEGWDNMKFGLEGLHFDLVNGERVYKEAFNEYYKWRGSYKLVMPSLDANYFINPSFPKELQEKLGVWLEQAVERVVPSYDFGFRPPAADLPEYIEYQSKMEADISKIIIGELPVDAWDATLEGWYKNGGELYMQQMNEHIAATQK